MTLHEVNEEDHVLYCTVLYCTCSVAGSRQTKHWPNVLFPPSLLPRPRVPLPDPADRSYFYTRESGILQPKIDVKRHN